MYCDVSFDVAATREALINKAIAVLDAAASFALERAQSYAPVDTGALRASGQIIPDSDPLTVWVAFTAPYSAFVELGHYTPHQTAWVPPYPFLRPGIADAAAQWSSLVTQTWINTVAKPGGGHYYASRFAYSRANFEAQYTSLGFPLPGPSD